MNNNSQNSNFLGRGWGFPPTFTRALPGVDMLEKEADIRSSLEVLLSTVQGERIMLPNYGCNMDELLFESLDTTTKTFIADKIETAILYHEPRIKVEKIVMKDDQITEGIVLIEIEYTVRSTNTRFNFVYPFYRLEGTDINLVTTFPATST
jgi:phage baseplate assembly protein W